MLKAAVTRIVSACAQHPWQVLVTGMVLAVAVSYDAARFSITTDTDNLIANNLAWRQREVEFSKAFPQSDILVAITARTPEGAEEAANALERDLAKRSDLFQSVVQQQGGKFFQRNGLLFEPLSKVEKSMAGLASADMLVSTLAADPSLHGVLKALDFSIEGVEAGQIKLDQLAWPLSLANETLDSVLAGKPTMFSWQTLVQGSQPPPARLRRFIEVQPILNFSDLQPGRKATNGIHQAVTNLHLSEKFGATVQLTGTVPMNDDQFSVIRQSAVRDTVVALLGTLAILWVALRSWKIVVSVYFSVIVGLVVTAALGLALVGAFNLLSIAFFVLFVGLGVDFGIQFSVRYRSERHKCGDLHEALSRAAYEVAVPLTLAAVATAIAFFSFLPTSYRGLSELGMIAGCGMLVAFVCSITLVPAMLAILAPPGEASPVGFKSLGRLDDFLQRHRMVIIVGTFLAVIAGAPLLLRLPFDFNPINLQDPQAPSVVTYHELQGNPLTSGTDAEVLAGSLAQANAIATHLVALPEVLRTLTLNAFVPDDQDRKMGVIENSAPGLRTALDRKREPKPSDVDTVNAIRSTAASLMKMAGNGSGPGAQAVRQVSALLKLLAQSDATTRELAESAFAPSLTYDLARLRVSLDPQHVTVGDLPSDLVRDWLLPDGRARVQILPRGNTSNDEVLRKFATSVMAAEPSATGPAISLYESSKTVVDAFIQAGAVALAAIAVLLIVALRRITDMLLTLIPLLLAGAVTLEICTLTHTVINFANIIALPLLLGVGVAFKIYYILAWREGRTGLLESSLTRAVIFSAMTNAVAFGSMWSSSYPGMSSMGKMMALALLCTMAAAVLFQPVLMGPPRHTMASPPHELGRLPEAAE
jgi:uncharacterized protein